MGAAFAKKLMKLFFATLLYIIYILILYKFIYQGLGPITYVCKRFNATHFSQLSYGGIYNDKKGVLIQLLSPFPDKISFWVDPFDDSCLIRAPANWRVLGKFYRVDFLMTERFPNFLLTRDYGI